MKSKNQYVLCNPLGHLLNPVSIEMFGDWVKSCVVELLAMR